MVSFYQNLDSSIKDAKFQRLAKDFLYVTIVNCLDTVSVSPVVERANDAMAQVCIFIKLTLALTCTVVVSMIYA